MAYQSLNKINISKSPSSPHLLNGIPNYHQNVDKNTSEANKNSFKTNKNIPELENQQSQTGNKKQTFVGNLNNELNIKDLKTNYLKKNYIIIMPINRKTEKNNGIAFMLSLDHIHNELLKLNGIEFHGKSLILEEAMSTGKKSEKQRQRQYRRPQVVVNNFPENKDTFKKQMLCQEIQRAKMRRLTAIKTKYFQ